VNILLVNPYLKNVKGIEGTKYPPLGLLYLASVLELDGHKIWVLDASLAGLSKEKIQEWIDKNKIELVGFTVGILSTKSTLEICEYIKAHKPELIIAVGGPMPTSSPEIFTNTADYIIQGEGENSFRKLVSSIESNCSQPQIISISNNRTNIENLPFPAYHLLYPPLKEYSKSGRVVKPLMAPLLTSRGCPYKCVFCNKNIFGDQIIFRSSGSVTREIEWLQRKYGVRQIDILDDNFLFNSERAEEILDYIIDNKLDIAINCHNGLRADKLTQKIVKKLKKAGTFKVGIGVETSDYKLMQKIRKNLSIENAEMAVRWFRKERITVHLFFMLGLPGDTSQGEN